MNARGRIVVYWLAVLALCAHFAAAKDSNLCNCSTGKRTNANTNKFNKRRNKDELTNENGIAQASI